MSTIYGIFFSFFLADKQWATNNEKKTPLDLFLPFLENIMGR
jgi:hypothetical protein